LTAEHLFVITGASRGMGQAIAEQLLRPGHRLLCISRSASDTLAAHAGVAAVPLEQWTMDLSQPAAAASALEQWLSALPSQSWTSVTLVNNAALLARAGPLQDVDAAELSRALRVGLEAPMQLTAVFLRATAGWPAARRVLNISSGLGRRAMAGQAAYCAVKAGLDHFSRCVALDEARHEQGAKIVSLAPGVIDTDMQTQLRASDAARFPDSAMFRQLKEGGQLSTPQEAAARVLAYLARADFGDQQVADVRDA
jgi:benzil reductase ((S)-benzoin forming)